MEELSELIKAISKCTRDEYFDFSSSSPTDDHYDNEVEEIADVLIAISYIKYLDEIPDSDIQKWIDRKQKRQMLRDYDTLREHFGCGLDLVIKHKIINKELPDYLLDYAKKCMEEYNADKRSKRESEESIPKERKLGS